MPQDVGLSLITVLGMISAMGGISLMDSPHRDLDKWGVLMTLVGVLLIIVGVGGLMSIHVPSQTNGPAILLARHTNTKPKSLPIG